MRVTTRRRVAHERQRRDRNERQLVCGGRCQSDGGRRCTRGRRRGRTGRRGTRGPGHHHRALPLRPQPIPPLGVQTAMPITGATRWSLPISAAFPRPCECPATAMRDDRGAPSFRKCYRFAGLDGPARESPTATVPGDHGNQAVASEAKQRVPYTSLSQLDLAAR